jgi:hypothetical protein
MALADPSGGVDAERMARASTKPGKPWKAAPAADIAPPPEKRWLAIAIGLALALVTLVVYSGALSAEFSVLDDDQYVRANPHVSAGLNLSNIAWAFTHQHAAMYHPLTTLSHMLDVQLFGMNPAGHHLINVLLHTASSVLLFVALRMLTRQTWPSAFVAAVFALHPQHVESVAWVSERKDVLSGLFFMLCLIAYARYARGPSIGRYLLLCALFAMGLLSKPMLVTLPIVLLLLDCWPLGRFHRREGEGPAEPRSVVEKSGSAGAPPSSARSLLLEKVPLLALSGVASLVALMTQQSIGAVSADIPFPYRMANAVLSVMRYAGIAFLPTELSVYYPHPIRWPIEIIVTSIIGLLLFTLLILLLVRQRPYLFVGWCWFLVMLAPVIGIIQVGVQALADRYAYLPSIGLSIAVTWLVCEAIPLARHRLATSICVGMLLLICCVRTIAQVETWKNPEALFATSIENGGDHPMLHNLLAQAIWNHGRHEEAIEEWRALLSVVPNDAHTHQMLGSNLMELGRLAEAEHELLEAQRLDPKDSKTYMFLAGVRQMQGNLDAAIPLVERAITLDPNDEIAPRILADMKAQRAGSRGESPAAE